MGTVPRSSCVRLAAGQSPFSDSPRCRGLVTSALAGQRESVPGAWVCANGACAPNRRRPCRRPVFRAPSMGAGLRVKVSTTEVDCTNPSTALRASQGQVRHREVRCEGSRRQNCALRNTNSMRGRVSRASWQVTAKPDAIKGWRGRWGRGAGKVSVLTWGDLLPGSLRTATPIVRLD